MVCTPFPGMLNLMVFGICPRTALEALKASLSVQVLSQAPLPASEAVVTVKVAALGCQSGGCRYAC